ncbi:MAG: hypothetical protein AB8G05_08615 [Oligoflexales bacterium]
MFVQKRFGANFRHLLVAIIFCFLWHALSLQVFAEAQQVKVEEKQFFKEKKKLKPFPDAESYTSIGVLVDCLHDFNLGAGEAQNCLTLNGLRLNIEERFHSELRAKVSLDPFATLNSRYDGVAMHQNKPYLSQYSRLGPIADYQLIWSPRKNLELALELYKGASYFPNTSKLSLGGSLADSGWKQSAVSVTYLLPMLEGVIVKFVGGNGEGELGQNTDPQQYFGFELHGEIIKGLEFHGGFSLDGNHVGSSVQEWERAKMSTGCNNLEWSQESVGFTTRRTSAAIETNGRLPFAQGLKMGVGWQKSIFSDLDKDKASAPSLSDLEQCNKLDPDYLFLEDPGNSVANSIDYTMLGLNASYLILDTYFLGFDYEKRTISSDLEYFQLCESYVGSECLNPSSARDKLEQWAYTVGMGLKLSEGLIFSLSYNTSSFAHLYKKFYYEDPKGNGTNQREIFNARVAYNWGS